MIARHCASLGLALGLISPAYRAVAAQGVQREHTSAPIRPNSRFTLTPTQNIWTSLLLDSSTGRIWQVHFAVSDSSIAGRLALNEEAFAPEGARCGGRWLAALCGILCNRAAAELRALDAIGFALKRCAWKGRRDECVPTCRRDLPAVVRRSSSASANRAWANPGTGTPGQAAPGTSI